MKLPTSLKIMKRRLARMVKLEQTQHPRLFLSRIGNHMYQIRVVGLKYYYFEHYCKEILEIGLLPSLDCFVEFLMEFEWE